MAQIYTSQQVNSITNYRYLIFVQGQNVGPCTAEDLEFTYEPNVGLVTTSMGGEAPIVGLNKGAKPATLKFNINNLNKQIIKNIYSNMIESTSTSISAPFTGTLKGISNIGRIPEVEVVAVLFYTKLDGTFVTPDTNPFGLEKNIRLKKAIMTDGGKFMFGPSQEFKFPVTYTGLADPLDSLSTFDWGDGITPMTPA